MSSLEDDGLERGCGAWGTLIFSVDIVIDEGGDEAESIDDANGSSSRNNREGLLELRERDPSSSSSNGLIMVTDAGEG